jgi:hypothetical protein
MLQGAYEAATHCTLLCVSRQAKYHSRLDPRRVEGGDDKPIEDWKLHVRRHIVMTSAAQLQSAAADAPITSITDPRVVDFLRNQCRRMCVQYFTVRSLRSRPADSLAARLLRERQSEAPLVYRQVLHLLRQADRSGLWPASSVARQKVIEAESLVENDGAGGSFSIGVYPKPLLEPKGNTLFPGNTRMNFDYLSCTASLRFY